MTAAPRTLDVDLDSDGRHAVALATFTEWDGAPGVGIAVYTANLTPPPAGTVTVWLPAGMPRTRINLTLEVEA